jgi:hypothetical protein
MPEPLTLPYRPPVLSMGVHLGTSRRLARGLRAACRPVPRRWADEVADAGEVRRVVLGWLDRLWAPEGLDAIAWVPGHDASAGPGYRFASLVGEAWSVPVLELVERRVPVPSAWESPTRPSAALHRASLRAMLTSRWLRVAVADNTIGSGASIAAVSDTLRNAGHDVVALVAVTAPGVAVPR